MIVRSHPASDLDQAELAWFDSDASSNETAIREIDTEAGRHGLARVRETWLQRFKLPDGRLVYRGFCYRPPPSDLAERVATRRGNHVEGEPSERLIRQMRDEE